MSINYRGDLHVVSSDRGPTVHGTCTHTHTINIDLFEA